MGSLPTSWMTGLRMHIPAGHPGGDSAMKLPLTSARPPVDGSPARTVSTSAAGFTSLALMPNAFSRAGVATYMIAPPDPLGHAARRAPRAGSAWAGRAPIRWALTARSSSSGAGACSCAASVSASCLLAASLAAGVNWPGWYWLGSLPGA